MYDVFGVTVVFISQGDIRCKYTQTNHVNTHIAEILSYTPLSMVLENLRQLPFSHVPFGFSIISSFFSLMIPNSSSTGSFKFAENKMRLYDLIEHQNDLKYFSSFIGDKTLKFLLILKDD